MVETIHTDRLVLRPLRPSDAGPISLHASDARVARMTASIPHPTRPARPPPISSALSAAGAARTSG